MVNGKEGNVRGNGGKNFNQPWSISFFVMTQSNIVDPIKCKTEAYQTDGPDGVIHFCLTGLT